MDVNKDLKSALVSIFFVTFILGIEEALYLYIKWQIFPSITVIVDVSTCEAQFATRNPDFIQIACPNNIHH